MKVPLDTLRVIQLLLEDRSKKEAMDLLQHVTKCSQKEAEDYVGRGVSSDIAYTGNIDDPLRILKMQRKTLYAVKAYKDHFKKGLQESVDYVEMLK